MKKYVPLFEDFVNSTDILELSNYGKKYLEDFEDVYNGPVYLNSDKSLTLEEIKQHETINARMFNRADASDTTSEYIYILRFIKPLYKKEKDGYFDFDFLDDPSKEKIDKSKFSGHFSYNPTFSEMYATVKTSDIKEFKLIGGFVKYDKHVPQKPDLSFSEETDDFLYSFISGTILHKKATPEIIKELEGFKPTEPVKIYKGIEEVQIRHHSEKAPPYNRGEKMSSQFPFFTSWSRNPLIGRRFIDDYPSSTPFLIEMTADPVNILVDVQMLPKSYYHTNQREIIMKPELYSYRIVWKGGIH